MSDIVKVTEEEFDDEGNLVKRTITEYGFTPKIKSGVLGHLDPSFQGQIVQASDYKFTVWNGPVKLREIFDSYNYGTYARRVPGGTDKDREGVVAL